MLLFFLSHSSFGQTLAPKATYDFFETLPDGSKLRELTYITCNKNHDPDHYEQLKKQIGWVYPTNCRVRVVKKNNEGKGYDVTFDINKLGQRMTEQSSVAKTKHLILAGDSNTFGQGVHDNETLPYLLGQKYPQYRVYNFGQRGGGPSNTLALLEGSEWKEEIRESEGHMLYIYYPAWMAMRVYGSKDFLSINRGNSPWYEIEENGELVRKGNLRDKWLSKFFLVIGLLDRFHWIGDLPKLTLDHVNLISKVIIKMRDKYMESFPKGKFTLVMNDYLYSTKDFVPELAAFLKRAGVNIVELNKTGWQRNPKLHNIDEHFNAEGQKAVANALEKATSFQ